jgi:hypothetical protein
MKNKIFNFLAVISITGLLFSCKKDEVLIDMNNVTQLKDAIKGEWIWDYSINPWNQQTLTPQSEGYSEKLQFLDNNILHVFRNDTLFQEVNWDISRRPVDILNPGGDSVSYLLINETPDLFELSQSTLRINQTPYDGPDKYYKKK